MSYRKQFSNMPELEHDRVWKNSKVLAYISNELGLNIQDAEMVFNHLRKQKIVLYDRVKRSWRGCGVSPVEKGKEIDYLLLSVADIQAKMKDLSKKVLKNAKSYNSHYFLYHSDSQAASGENLK